MNDYQWLRARLFQYLLFKGDTLRACAEKATHRLSTSKCLQSSDLSDIYRDLLLYELFDEVQREVIELIGYYTK